MANPIIVDPAAFDSYIITGSSCVGSMSVSNALRPQPSDKVRFTDITDAYVVLEDPDANGRYFDTVWIGYHNGVTTSDFRVRTSDVSAADCVNNPSNDSGWLPMYQDIDDKYITRKGHTLLSLETPIKSHYIRIDMRAEDAVEGYFEFGRLVVGLSWKPTWGVSFGARFGVEETSTRIESQGGQIYSRVGLKRKTFSGSIQFIDEDEAWKTREELSVSRGISGQVLFCFDALYDVTTLSAGEFLTTKTIYGVMGDPMTMSLPGYGYYETTFSITETP